MKARVLTGTMAVLVMLGLSVPPVWADEDSGHSRGTSGEYGSHGGGGMMGHHGGTGHYLRHLLRHQKEIGLTAEQTTKLKALRLDLDRARIRTEAEIQVAERELVALLEDGTADLSPIEAKVKQSAMLEVEVRMAAIKARREAVALLTPEQREKEEAEHEKMMRQRREGGMGAGMMGEMMGERMKGGRHGGPPKPESKKGGEKKEPSH